tara:strand:- start:3311 stop:4447 length:1137 start_codon:yes stop_codon:yes gene_type:complete
MGLITETNAQYYAGQQEFLQTNSTNTDFQCTFDTNLIASVSNVSNPNFSVYLDGVLKTQTTDYVLQPLNIIRFVSAPSLNSLIRVELNNQARFDNNGEYEYIKIKDVVDNFMTAYVGDGKYITNVKRKDVVFHAKRGLQEFSYDTLRSLKSQELSIPDSLNIIIPQDYVNYTRLAWVDSNGVQRTIFPANALTMNPVDPLIQDTEGEPIQDNFQSNIEAAQGLIEERWNSSNERDLTGDRRDEESNVYNWAWWKTAYGQRYGMDPAVSQSNGWFTIDDRRGMFSFSSDLVGKVITLEYISDGLAYDADTKIPKMIEEAMYMHIVYSILSSKMNVPEYVVQRFKKDRRAQLRNAKIRLSNLKLDTLIQTMRGKSKWLKH